MQRKFLCVFLAGWTGAIFQPAFATDFVWDGGGVDDYWTNQLNWNLDSGFPNGVTDKAIFSNISGNVLISTNVEVGVLEMTGSVGRTFDDVIGSETIKVDNAINYSCSATTYIKAHIALTGIMTVASGTLELECGSTNDGLTGVILITNGTVRMSSTDTAGDVVIGDGAGAARSAVLILSTWGLTLSNRTISVASDGQYKIITDKGKVTGGLTMHGGEAFLGGSPGTTLSLYGDVYAVSTNTGMGTATITYDPGSSTAGKIEMYRATRTFTVDDGPQDVDFDVQVKIQETGGYPAGLIKAGNGVMRLTTTNTYTGLTAVNAGTLLVDGIVAGGVNVAGNAMLGGCGRVAGSVTNFGTLSPGTGSNSVGVLAIGGGLTMADASAALELHLNDTNMYDRVAVTGAVSLAGCALNVSINYAPANTDEVYIVLNNGNDAVSGTFSNLVEGTRFRVTPRWNARISYIGNGDGGSASNDVKLYSFDAASGTCIVVR